MALDRTEIAEIESRLIEEGIKTSDIEFLDRILHDELLFIAPDGSTITKKMDLDAHRAGAMVVDELLLNIEDIRIMGDTAVSVVVYDTKGTMLGTPIQGRFRYIRVWKQFSDGLKVIGGSCSALQ